MNDFYTHIEMISWVVLHFQGMIINENIVHMFIVYFVFYKHPPIFNKNIKIKDSHYPILTQ